MCRTRMPRWLQHVVSFPNTVSLPPDAPGLPRSAGPKTIGRKKPTVWCSRVSPSNDMFNVLKVLWVSIAYGLLRMKDEPLI